MPKDVPEFRVREKGREFAKMYVQSYEKEGYQLKSQVQLERLIIPLAEDITNHERRYLLRAWWDRKPEKITLEVDEKVIPALLATGKFQSA